MADLKDFLKNVAKHEMAIEMDSGVHRSIQFKRAGTYSYQFRLVTWPGHLAISGDMGDYVFARTADMFAFFRDPGMKNEINTSYWHEKMVAQDKSCPAKEFSGARLAESARHHFENWEGPFGEAAKIWKEVEDEVLHATSVPEAYQAISEFESSGGHDFRDFESDLTEYSFHFRWILRAIVWGIKQYDLQVQGRTQADHDRKVLEGEL